MLFAHVMEAGMDVLQVRVLILQDLEWKLEVIAPGLYRGQVVVEGVLLEYRAFQFEDGSVNVGRITLL